MCSQLSSDVYASKKKIALIFENVSSASVRRMREQSKRLMAERDKVQGMGSVIYICVKKICKTKMALYMRLMVERDEVQGMGSVIYM